MTTRTAPTRTSASADVKADGTDISCLKEPSFAVIRVICTGRRTGARCSASASRPRSGHGQLRHRALDASRSDKPAFSPDTADWNKGRFLTDIDTPGKGVLDAEVSPDGKRLALVSNQGSAAFRLWLADDPEDFALSSAKQTPVRACKVTWRGDSKEVLVVQGDAALRGGRGRRRPRAGQRRPQPEGAEPVGR